MNWSGWCSGQAFVPCRLEPAVLTYQGRVPVLLQPAARAGIQTQRSPGEWLRRAALRTASAGAAPRYFLPPRCPGPTGDRSPYPGALLTASP